MDEAPAKKRKKPSSETPAAVDPWGVVSSALMIGLGVSSFLLAPLPVLVAHWRHAEPWPKIATLLGTALAVVALGTPVAWAAIALTLSLVLADRVNAQDSVWKSLLTSSVAALAVAVGMLFYHAQLQGLSALDLWRQTTQKLVSEARTSLEPSMQMKWGSLETILFEQAPFLILGLCLIAAWVSLGAAVHFGWTHPDRPMTGRVLRDKIRLPMWLSIAFSIGFVANLVVPLPFYLAGVVRVASSLLFIQGCACLSDILDRRAVPRFHRTWVYGLSLLFGFYALLALGVVSPWYFRVSIEERKVG